MLTLILGLVIFIGVHSVRIVVPNWRELSVDKKGLVSWRIRFGLLSILSLGFIVMGYAEARLEPIWLWFPPLFMRHVTSLIMLLSLFVLFSAMIPKSTLKKKLIHPIYIAIKVWAFAHLLSNGNAADVLLFGSFLIWSVVSFSTFRRRDKAAGLLDNAMPEGSKKESALVPNLIALSFSLVSWFVIVAFLHKAVIGVSPLI